MTESIVNISLNVVGPELVGHNMKIMKRVAKRDVRKDFFSHRVVENWNSLKDDVVSARNIHNFKKRYAKLQQSCSMP